MSRLKPTEIAILLERLRAVAPKEADVLEAHIESSSTEDAMTALVREMVEAKERSVSAERETARILSAWQPVIEGSAAQLERAIREKERANDLEARRLDLAESEMKESARQRSEHIRGIVVPIVTALAGAMTSATAFYFGGAAGGP